jgi:mannose-6-phosphate isomerase
MQKKMLVLPPNRVRRNYKGGLLLEKMCGSLNPQDGSQPEDWIASTVGARNPGLEEVVNEGFAFLFDSSGKKVLLKYIFAADALYYLGKRHVEKLGPDLGFLAKLLDSSMRLHLQAHPTADYAKKNLNSRWGKLETYYILGVRPECDGYIWLGFQKSPGLAEWTRIVMEQDKVAMNACFQKVPVKPGQVWVIPGGLPHAIGEGLFVLEVMEPTDWVVRCEFEREGIVVPPAARFMGLKPEESLKIFDFEEFSVSQIQKKCGVEPIRLQTKKNGTVDLLIGPKQTECFVIRRVLFEEKFEVEKAEIVYIGIVSQGSGRAIVGDESIELKSGTTFLVPASVSKINLESMSGKMEIIFCSPGYDIERI